MAANNTTKPTSIDILGVRVDNVTMKQTLDLIGDWIASNHQPVRYIVKPYVEFMVGAQATPQLMQVLNGADLSVADGVSLQWAASFLYAQPQRKPTLRRLVASALWRIQQSSWRQQVITEKFAGVNFTAKLLAKAEEEGWRIGVLGGPRDTAQTIAGLHRRFPKLNLVDVWSGYTPSLEATTFATDEEDAKLRTTLAAIHSAKLDILFVALGFPRQELFMAHFRNSIKAKVMIGEGGSFDYDQLGGSIKRAPQWLRKLNLEWLWRLALQPKRLIRQLAVPRFTWAVYRQSKLQWRRSNQEK